MGYTSILSLVGKGCCKGLFDWFLLIANRIKRPAFMYHSKYTASDTAESLQREQQQQQKPAAAVDAASVAGAGTVNRAVIEFLTGE